MLQLHRGAVSMLMLGYHVSIAFATRLSRAMSGTTLKIHFSITDRFETRERTNRFRCIYR